jgi:3-hydroxyisobutyrate dehydrogenase
VNVGFIGLGLMGSAMALNMARAGIELVVWNRTREKCEQLEGAGASVAASVQEVFAASSVIILMLANSEAIDSALERGTPIFGQMVKNRIVVHMGTTSPRYSKELDAEIQAAGGRYVEAPVSGSRKPAELGQLVGMMAGDQDALATVRPLLAPVCAQVFSCGAVPQALLMKLSVNLYLITMVTGLAEAAHFAQRQGLDLHLFREILDAGPMASNVSRLKLPKIVAEDFSPQASINDVLMNNRLIVDAARDSEIASPLLDICCGLFADTQLLGHGAEDMAAVIHAIAARTAQQEKI